jgi:PST family polysaccharide transporter
MTTYDNSTRHAKEYTGVTDPKGNSSDTLAAKAASGMGWNLVGFAVRAGAGVGINILLARLLGPEPFGLVAIAMVIIALGNLLVDSGLGIQLIRNTTISAKMVRGVLTLQLLLGLVLAAATILSVPLITALLKQENARPVIRALAFMLVIVSAGQTSTALLRRDLRFAAIQKIQIISYLIGFGALGIPLAYAGAGVWTLVWAQLTQATLCTVMSWMLVRHSLVPYIGPESATLLRFGSFLAGSNVISWSIGAMPSFLIGRTLGAATLGLYNRAYMLVGVPLNALVSPLQTVSLSLYSRLQENEDTVRRAFLAIIALIALLVFPFLLLVAGTAGTLIQVVLGHKWSQSAPVLVPLAFAMSLDAIASVCSPLLISRGRPDLDLRTQAIAAASGGLCMAVAGWMNSSLLTLTWIVCVCLYLVRASAAIVFAKRVLHIPSSNVARALFGGLFLGAVASITAGTLNAGLATWAAWPRLLLSWGAGVGAVVSVFVLFPTRLLYRDLVWFVTGRGLPIPVGIDKWLRSLVPGEDRVAVL